MSWVAAAVGVGTAAYKIGEGEHQKNVAKKNQKELEASRGKYSESPYYQQQLALAGEELSSDRQGDALNEGLDQDLATSLSALTKMGGSPNDVASVFSSNSQGRARYAMLRSNIRLQKISNYQKALDAKEEDRERAFGYNVTAPFKDKAAANAEALRSGQADISSGIDTLGSAIASGAETYKSTQQLKNYFNTQGVGDNSNDVLKKDTIDNSLQPTGGNQYEGTALDINYLNPNR